MLGDKRLRITMWQVQRSCNYDTNDYKEGCNYAWRQGRLGPHRMAGSVAVALDTESRLPTPSERRIRRGGSYLRRARKQARPGFNGSTCVDMKTYIIALCIYIYIYIYIYLC